MRNKENGDRLIVAAFLSILSDRVKMLEVIRDVFQNAERKEFSKESLDLFKELWAELYAHCLHDNDVIKHIIQSGEYPQEEEQPKEIKKGKKLN